MSTDYVTREPITLAEFQRRAAEHGWQPHRGDGGRGPMGLMGPTGFAYGTEEVVGHDGKTRVSFTRFGMNVVDELVELFDCASEYDDDEFLDLMGDSVLVFEFDPSELDGEGE